MKTNRFIFFLVFILIAGTGFSQQVNSPYSMILSGDPVLDDILFLSLDSGIPFLSFAPPLPPGEIRDFIDKINENELSQPAIEAYYRILDRLSPSARISFTGSRASAFLDIDLITEVKVRFNQEISWYPHKYANEPFLGFTFQFFFVDSLQLYFEPTFHVKSMSPNDHRYTDGYFDSNIPYKRYDFSVNYWPMKAFASVGGSWWNFYIGRDHLSWGTSHSGGLVYSDNMQFYDFAYLSLFSPFIKYSVIINHLPLYMNYNLFDGEPPPGWDDPGNNRSNHRYFYLHRLDFTVFSKASVSLMEGVMVGNSPLELRYLNPMIVFHSMYPWRDYGKWEPGENIGEGSTIGAFFSLEVNWNITEQLAVYGQFVMNQFALWLESADVPDQPPNSLGYLAGAHYTHSFNTWGSLFYFEFVYTSPYAYILSSPYSSFIKMINISHNYHISLLGHSRDTVLLTAGAEFFNADKTLYFSGNFTWIASGELNKGGVFWIYSEASEAFSAKSPTGVAENKFILSLDAKWQLYSWLGFGASITGIYAVNNKHKAGSNAAGGQMSFSVSLNY